MNTIDFLFKSLVHKTVLLNHRDPFGSRVRDGNCIKRSAPFCTTTTIEWARTVNVGAEWRTRDVLFEQLRWLETL